MSARTSPTSTSATSALRTAGTTTAWVSSLGTARSGPTKGTRQCNARPARVHRPAASNPFRVASGAKAVYSPCVDFIAGTFAEPQRPDGVIEDRSPADLEMLLGRHGWALSQVDRAVEAARAAQPSWAARSSGERAALIRRIGEVLKSREEELARAIAVDV